MTESTIRPDGRAPDELRKLEVEVGTLDRADGSATVKLGKNLAIASVYGPREMHPRHASEPNNAVVRINYRMATFSVTDYKRSFPSRREKEISKVLSEAFSAVVITKSFPRSALDIHVQIFESDGGTRTAAAIAVSAALADAGIPMKDITGGIASGIYEDQVVLDLTGKEDMKGTGDMPLLYSPEIDEVSLFQLDGLFTFEQFKQAYNYSLKAIEIVAETIKDALKKKYILVRDELSSGAEEVASEEDLAQVDQISPEDEAEAYVPEVVKPEKSIEPEVETVREAAVTSPEPVVEPVADVVETQVVEEEKPVEKVKSPLKYGMPISTGPPEVLISESEPTDPTVVEPTVEEDKPKETDISEEPASNLSGIMSNIAAAESVEAGEPVEIDEGEFDRSKLKPMGGVTAPNSTIEEKKKKDEEADASDDIMRDLDYASMEDDN